MYNIYTANLDSPDLQSCSNLVNTSFSEDMITPGRRRSY